MKLKQARALAAELRAAGHRCSVPLGYAPDGYFVRVETAGCSHVDCETEIEAREMIADAEMEYQRQLVERASKIVNRPRSPIEAMIDRACGLE